MGAKDMLLIRLPDPVPKGFSPLPRYTGSEAQLPGDKATIVGFDWTADTFGTCVQDATDRRHGTQLTKYFSASAGAIEWVRPAGLDAFVQSSATLGDSGGPLLVGEAGSRAVAGVFSYFFGALNECESDFNQWAGIVSSKAWLDSVLAAAAPDADGDSVPDECDACALGNDHDRCPAGSINAGTPKACAACGCDGKDSDGDGACDNVDNCPAEGNGGQEDADSDGVGDVCDNCAGLGTSPAGVDRSADRNNVLAMACVTTADNCAAITQNSASVCVQDPFPAALGQGHCSKFRDTDGDGLGDDCDNCPNTANPAGGPGSYKGDINGQANCDLLAQVARGEPYPFVGDACNPNPCNRLFHWASDFSDPHYKPNSGVDLWLNVSYNPQILPNSYTPTPLQTQSGFENEYLGTPKSTVGMRFCPCTIENAWECHNLPAPNGCRIDPAQYDTLPWRQLQLISTPTGPLPTNPVFAPNAELTDLPMAAAPGTTPLINKAGGDHLGGYLSGTSFASWDLTASGATQSTKVGEGVGLRGVLWTAVRFVPLVKPSSVPIFQELSNRYKGGWWGTTKTVNGLTRSACPQCDWGECEYCKEQICKTCLVSRDAKRLVISPELEKVYVQSNQGVVDVTNEFTLEARGAIFEPGARWLTLSERGGWAALGSLQLAFATLSADASTIRSVLVTDSAGVTKYPTPLASSGPAPAPRSEFGAVLSTRENAIFVAGGKLESGTLAGDLWMYSITQGTWTELSFTGPAPQKVIAATYLADTRSLWLVDQTEENPVLARMLRYDLETHTIHQAGKWPRTPSVDRVELSGAPLGNLLLSSSSTKIGRVVGVVIKHRGDGAKGGELEVLGAFMRKGTLAVEPTLSDTVLTLPLVSDDPTGSDTTVIPATELFFGQEKKEPKAPAPCLEAPCQPGPPRVQITQVL